MAKFMHVTVRNNNIGVFVNLDNVNTIGPDGNGGSTIKFNNIPGSGNKDDLPVHENTETLRARLISAELFIQSPPDFEPVQGPIE